MKLLEKWKMELIVKGRNEYKECILHLLEEDKNAVVLDLGCGEGRRLTYRVLGKIGTTRKAFGLDLEYSKEDKIEIRSCDLNEEFPFSSGFDVVIASQIIEHLWNTDGFLKEIYRVLKPTGYAIISTPCLDSWPNILYLLRGGQPECLRWGDMYPWMEKPGHLRVFTRKELARLLEFHRFRIEKVVSSGYILGRPTTVTIKVRRVG